MIKKDDDNIDNTATPTTVNLCKNYNSSEYVPIFLLIDGDPTNSGLIVNDVFAAKAGGWR